MQILIYNSYEDWYAIYFAYILYCFLAPRRSVTLLNVSCIVLLSGNHPKYDDSPFVHLPSL